LAGGVIGDANLLFAQSAALSQTATIQSLSIYVAAGTGNLILGIYADNGSGAPGALQAQTASFSVAAGWNTANVTAPVSLQLGTYWIAWLTNSNTLNIPGVTTGTDAYYAFSFGSLPSTFSGAATIETAHRSLYATLNTSVSQSISSVSLSNSSFVGGSPSGTVVGAINVAMSPSSPAFAGSLSLSTTQGGCTASNGANNSSFVISGNNLVTNRTVAPGSYAVCILATQAGATNSPLGQATTITASQSISSVSLSNASFVGGSPSGTVVGTINVAMSPSSAAFSGSLSLSTTQGGCNATNGANNGSFLIVGTTLETNGSVSAGGYAVCILATAASAPNSPFGQNFTLTGQGSQSIQSIALSNNSTTTGLASSTAVGTLSVSMSTATPIFSYNGTNLHLSTSGADSGGVCSATNGAGNGSFQITAPDSTHFDTLATNGALTTGNKAICVAASEAGVSAKGQAFTITVGTVRDAAAGVGVGGCTGNGTSGSPWNYLCVQNAINAAVDGDTVFLRGGNWALDTTADASHVTIYNKAITLAGVASGNTFDTWGHINNLKPVSPNPTCPTAGTSITCVYQTGQSYSYQSCPGFPWACPGYIHVGPTSNSTADPNCHDVTIAHIYFDGSQTTAGGDLNALLSFIACAGPITLNDLRFIAGTGNSVGGGGTSVETQISPGMVNNMTILNSEFADPLNPNTPGTYAGPQVLQITGGNGIGTNYLIKNNVIYQGAYNPIYINNVTFDGNQSYNFNDGTAGPAIFPSHGYAGDGLGGFTGNSATGVVSGDVNLGLTNSLWYGPGEFMSIGSTLNDPHTSGGLLGLNVTGNWLIAATPDIDTCTWHLFVVSGTIECSPGNAVGMAINVAVDASCNTRNNGTAFNVTNNSLKGTVAAYLDAAGSISSAPSGDWTYCKIGVPWNGTSETQIPVQIYGYNAQKNWLSSPSNQYVTNSNTISPVQTGNFCTPAAGTVTGCATSGFNTAPTASFTLGSLGVGNIVPISNTTFTAQYGAVQWLASTSSTAPLANDTRWSSNNAGFPNSQANTYIPPVSLPGVHHGDTVYLWVMDSGNHIAAATPQVVP
jgi:hypothetical protein